MKDLLLNFASKEEEIEHKAHMISFRFLSEVEIYIDKKGIKKSDLAKMIGTSKSYITQLFRGDKMVNMELLARLEYALGIEFKIKQK